QFDPDLGLYYLRARYYNPATGRFLSRDPKEGWIDDPATLHKYLYANGDPVNALDPTGRESLIANALLRAWSTAKTIVVAAFYNAKLRCLLSVINFGLNLALGNT